MAAIAKGEMSYVDFAYYFGPLAIYLQGWLMRWLGCRLEVLYVTGLLTIILVSVLLYRLVKELGGSPTDDSTLIPSAGDSWSNINVSLNIKNSTLSAPRDVRVLSSIEADSSTITTEGSFTMASSWGKLRHDWSNPDAPYGLNLSARGDVKIGTYKDTADSFSQLAMHGLVYTWGNFEALTGHPDVDPSRWKHAKFTGTIVAYGNDPAQGEPGEGAGGKVNIVSRSVGLWSDFGSLAKVVETNAQGVSTDFEQTLFVTHCSCFQPSSYSAELLL